jgi:hypothetical protein
MKKNVIDVHVDKNAFTDDGEGILRFPGGQVITDASEQRNGTKYDIETLDITEWNGTITADHDRSLVAVVGKALGFAKRGSQVVLDGIQFAIKTAAGRLAYDLMREGFVKDMSIETYGPWPDDSDDTYYKAKLVGMSIVVVGNNRSARLNELALNSLARSKEEGLDTQDLEQLFQKPEKPKGAEAPNKAPEPQKPSVEEKQEDNTNDKQETTNMAEKTEEATKTADQKVETQAEKPAEKTAENTAQNAQEMATAIQAAVEAAVKPLQEQVTKFEDAFKNSAEEPGFKKDDGSRGTSGNALNDLEKMDWRERTATQIQSLYAGLKGDRGAQEKAFEINSLHLEQLKKAGLAANALTLTDIGNFVIPPEMITEIKGHVSNYRPLLEKFNFQETMSLDTAWIERTGEIQMSDVEMEEDGANGDLKPISEPTYDTHTSRLKEFAAVTPVDASAIRFSAADIVGDISRMYKTAYDRALAQSVIGRLEKALESNGNSVTYNFSTANGGNVGALVSLIGAWAEVAENVPTGFYLMTMSTYLHLFEMSLRAGINSPLATIFTQGPDGIPRFVGLPYLVVPGDLLPNINTAGTKTWTFEGTSVTVNHAIIFADPANFMGRVSGGLNFQVSTEAAYEQSGTVRSAFQRDKVLFRGYGYRKSALTLTSDVAGVLAPGIS